MSRQRQLNARTTLASATLGAALLLLCGCHHREAVPEGPLPPNTVLLSQSLRELSSEPGFRDRFVKELGAARGADGKHGPALLTPRLSDELRNRVLGPDWAGLDRFPGWTMRQINPTVTFASRWFGRSSRLEGMCEAHPGAASPPSDARVWIDLGPYATDAAQTIDLSLTPDPAQFPAFTMQGIVSDLGGGLTRGDGPNPQLAPEHAASQRLADALNRLALNSEPGAQPASVLTSTRTAAPTAAFLARTPTDVIRDLQLTGHSVKVTDSRYFANFGHLHFRGQDVMMPFWVNTQLAVPHTGHLFRRPRPLLVPVTHAELEWHIRGPEVNADVSWYFGIDGKAEWRVMDTLDQAWVLKRDAHTYTGAAAAEATRLATLLTVAYMHQHARRPALPFGGYYSLGVCQDGVSAVELKLTGETSLFPNTVQRRLFDDARDAEANQMLAAIPNDRNGKRPRPVRVFESLPVDPNANPEHPFDAITIPGLAGDLDQAYAAFQRGKLRPFHSRIFYTLVSLGAVLVVCVLFALLPGRRLEPLPPPYEQA